MYIRGHTSRDVFCEEPSGLEVILDRISTDEALKNIVTKIEIGACRVEGLELIKSGKMEDGSTKTANPRNLVSTRCVDYCCRVCRHTC
jgi:hypothetical protein